MFYCITTWWSLSRDMFYCIATWWSLPIHASLYRHMVISPKTCFTVSPHGDLSRDMLHCMVISPKTCFTASPHGDLPRHASLYHHMVISQDMLYCITTWWSLKRHVLLHPHMVISQETISTVSPHGDSSRHATPYLSQHETFHLHSSWSYHQKPHLIVAQLYPQCYPYWFLYICSSLAHHIHHKGQYYWNQYNPKINKFLFNNNSNQFLSGSIQFLIQTLVYLVHQKIFISDFNTEE
jgi:hypothetical protein